MEYTCGEMKNYKILGYYQPPGEKLYPGGRNCSGRSQEDQEKDAQVRLDDKIFFMGITQHGYQRPIFEAINPSFKDQNEGKPELCEFMPHLHGQQSSNSNATTTKTTTGSKGANGSFEFDSIIDYDKISENFRSIDMDSGLVNGKNYGSFHRLRAQKKRHTRNSIGPEKKYCIPITDSMNIGWWIRDQNEINRTKWYCVRDRKPAQTSDITRFYREMAKHDPCFIPF